MEGIYIVPFIYCVYTASQSTQAWITQFEFYLQIAPCLPFFRKRWRHP